jgi:cytochrome c peroxidase
MKFLFSLFFIITSCLLATEPILPIPQYIPHTASKAALGKKLFFDPILSRDYTISCASCHDVSKGGADGKIVSTGIHHQQGSMNAPTVLNSAFNFTQFWNGRAKNLAEQALGPIHNPVEMGLSPNESAARIQSDPQYSGDFSKITGRKNVTINDIAAMIAEYEKTLITPNGKFDRYLRGEVALSPQEMKGYLLFKTLGCISCHNGVNVGGNSFQKMGAIVPIERKDNIDDRYSLTGRLRDKNIFKVPTLRNIAQTAPYFHDGSASTLQEAITKMSYHNLGLKLTENETESLIAFLDTLSGKLPSQAEHP